MGLIKAAAVPNSVLLQFIAASGRLTSTHQEKNLDEAKA